MPEVRRTIIVPLADVAVARNSAAMYIGGTGMFQAQLTSNVNGAPPATHFISSGQMDAQIPLAMPISADISDLDVEQVYTALGRLGLRQVLVNDD